MDISKTIAKLKQEPGFTENVGMVLVHNGIVRGWSRKGHETVREVSVTPDQDKIRQICAEIESRPGIFRAIAEAKTGTYKPGDDLLFLIVAGDIRENVKSALSDLLDRVKSEAMSKQEHII